jgi:hypothetical protein
MIGSCSQDPSDSIYKISGVVFQNGIPSVDVDILLKKNNETIEQTSTDQTGYFEFSAIPPSKYTVVSIKTYDNGSFVEYPTEVEVNEDTHLGDLLLPEPVILFTSEIYTDNAVTLKWSKYLHDNFYEYRIYRHFNSGLDESTGSLIHITTNVNDTVFTDNGQDLNEGLTRNTTYYYRIYINNDYGRLGGSNIQSITTRLWENEENFSVDYQLEQVTSFPGFGGRIEGVDYDGNYLWLLEVYEQGGFYDTNRVKLIQYDHLSQKIIKEFEFRDEYALPGALMWESNFLYVFYNFLQGPFIKKVSDQEGDIVRTYSSDFLEDMDGDGQYFIKSLITNEVEIADFNSFSLLSRFPVPFDRGTNSGVALRDSEIWLSARTGKQFIVFDFNGQHIGAVDCSILSDWNGINHLCTMENNLVYTDGASIYIFRIVGN